MKDVVLITGGAGVVGTNLIKKLIISKTTSKIIVADDLSSGRASNLKNFDIQFHKINISNPYELKDVFSYKPTKVYHLAALFANQNSIDHPVQDLTINGIGTLNVLNECIKCKVKKIVYASSSCVYGNSKNMNEKNIGNLDTPYAITKLLGEYYLQFFSKNYGIEATSVRIFNTYGPYDYPGKYRNVIPNFFYMAQKGLPLSIYGDGQSIRSYTYVEDIVDGLISLMDNFENKNKYDVFNCGSLNTITTIELAKKINLISENKAGIKFIPQRDWDHVHLRVPDLTKVQKIVKISQSHSLDEGLDKYYHWLINDANI